MNVKFNIFFSLETCKALASAGARVILCSRSIAAGEAAVTQEIQKSGHGGYIVGPELSSNIIVKQLDLASLPTIKAFAAEFFVTESRLDFLICNAGIMALPSLEFTEAGFEKQIGVNHFGHHYLTQLLLPLMLKNENSAGRIVVLSSSAHTMGSVRPTDLHYKNGEFFCCLL